MRKVRLITTFECTRNCPYCCNKQPLAMSAMRELISVDSITGCSELMITGGEPMLFIADTVKFIKFARRANPLTKIYLYLSTFENTKELRTVLELIDGAHYTLHPSSSQEDLNKFYLFQSVISDYRGKSFRLYIVEGMPHPVTVVPKLWSRVEVKPWLENPPLPEGESLFYLKDGRLGGKT